MKNNQEKIERRRFSQLMRLFMPLLTLGLVAAGAGAQVVSPLLPGTSSIGPVSRSLDKLDIFTTDGAGVIRTAAWEPDFTDGWHGWWPINGGTAPSGAPVTAVSRSTDKIDIFVVGNDGRIYTAAWEPDFTDGWHGWRPIGNLQVTPGTRVAAVSRSTDKLDIFVVGSDDQVWTAAWEPDFTDGWHGWSAIAGITVPAGSAVSAVSRSTDKLDIFVTDVDGMVQTAAWEPDFTAWHGWWTINNGQARPGAPVTVVSRSTDKLDIFTVGLDNRVWTAAWEPDFTSWHGWSPISGVTMSAGAFVSAVSRSTDKLDIFVSDADGNIETAAWEPDFTDGWHGWWSINNGQAAPGAPLTAVSRSTDKLDVFVAGEDHRVYTAAWEPDFTSWHGWFAIGAFPTAPPGIGPLQSGAITFDDGVPVGGSAQVSMWSDGSYTFEGSFHDSGLPSYNDTLVFVVKDNVTNTAYVFSHSGHMNGTLESGSRDDSWNESSRKIELQNAWPYFADGWQWSWSAGANADFNSIVDKALSSVGLVLGVVALF